MNNLRRILNMLFIGVCLIKCCGDPGPISPRNEVTGKLCNYEFDQIETYQSGEVFQCDSSLFKVNPPSSWQDAPSVVYDENGVFQAYCGGMPQPNAVPSSLCSVSCIEENICK